MEILNGWTGRLGLFFLAFPVVMLVIPLLFASLRQRLAWNKRQALDAGMNSPCTRPRRRTTLPDSGSSVADERDTRFLA